VGKKPIHNLLDSFPLPSPNLAPMRYLSVCSGIEAATAAWHDLNWQPVGYSEIEPFPSAVLAHHYPKVKNYGDLTRYRKWDITPGSVDLLVGGTPCQSFSVAGLRKGLADPRGNLALVFLGLADWLKPKWIVWENVPGVLSSNGGRDFGSFLGALAELGYKWAYRVLDAQYFGVAQRRRRVFVVGYFGNAVDPAAVLFEPQSVRGDPPPSRETRKKTPGGTASGAGASHWPAKVAPAMALPVTMASGQANAEVRTDGSAPTLTCLHEAPIMAHSFAVAQSVGVTIHGTDGTANVASFTDLSSSLRARTPSGVENSTTTAVLQVAPAPTASNDPSRSPQSSEVTQQVAAIHAAAMQVRRLTPVECERLQGFPDGYTAIPWRNKTADECPDGPRYKALGNSMAVPVMRWIGKRIQAQSE
jgi:DNA (cytosine-5)-methyltransferase 1